MNVRVLSTTLLVTVATAMSGCVAEGGDDADEADSANASEAISKDYGKRILDSKLITLADFHTSGVRDDATALHNIQYTAKNKRATTSDYGDARGKRVALRTTMLRGMLNLREVYSYTVSEIAGGDHSAGSLHYEGRALDVSHINVAGKQPIVVRRGSGAPYEAFMARCRYLGATEVLGPSNDAAHQDHVHCAWPR